MEQDLLEAFHATDPHLLVFVEQTRQEVLDLAGQVHMVGEGKLLVDDGFFDFFLVFGIEGRQACHQLVEKCAQGVEIHAE